MEIILDDGKLILKELPGGETEIRSFVNEGVYASDTECITSYPVPLIKKIAEVKGAAWVCNEIKRDEDENYIQNAIRNDLLSYAGKDEFRGKRILDFGCGSGASTSIVARMFPESEILGIEYVKSFVEIADMRKEHYGLENLRYLVSPDTESLPENIGMFDFVLFNGVFEHLLPAERHTLFPLIWSYLKSGGILFLTNTPNRLFPIELHTTSGLPFLNYLPDKISLTYSRKFSKRNLQDHSWEELLREGVRGGTINEIMGILKKTDSKPELLNPQNEDVKDRVDLWYKAYNKHSYQNIKKYVYHTLKIIKAVSGIELVPYLSLAIKKSDN
ncbi:MAG: methyltransferase domain-containing protein [Ignavibacteriae bacterium]|nr:methyltransferase domain-containing protein [Ignavibacteriota bacterium]